jgi:hypothetical protein
VLLIFYRKNIFDIFLCYVKLSRLINATYIQDLKKEHRTCAICISQEWSQRNIAKVVTVWAA